jgi:hypothetical protein
MCFSFCLSARLSHIANVNFFYFFLQNLQGRSLAFSVPSARLLGRCLLYPMTVNFWMWMALCTHTGLRWLFRVQMELNATNDMVWQRLFQSNTRLKTKKRALGHGEFMHTCPRRKSDSGAPVFGAGGHRCCAPAPAAGPAVCLASMHHSACLRQRLSETFRQCAVSRSLDVKRVCPARFGMSQTYYLRALCVSHVITCPCLCVCSTPMITCFRWFVCPAPPGSA